MATKATQLNPGNRQARPQGANPGAGIAVPFTAAAHEHTEIAFDTTKEIEAATQQLGPFDVPAYGYLRHLAIEVTTSVEAENEEWKEDYPFNIFTNIQLNDVNGAPIYGPLDGFAALQTNIFGGYAAKPDPRLTGFYAGKKSPSFIIRIPIEVSHRDGFGSLANQNAAAAYKCYLTLNNISGISKAGKEVKKLKVRIRGWLEAWSMPNPTDLAGRQQAQAPPLLDSASFHSYYQKSVEKGNNTVLLVRVGSLIRQIIVIARNASGERKDAVYPEVPALEWDSRNIREDSQLLLREMMEASVLGWTNTAGSNIAAGRDAGVFAYLFDRSDHNAVGDDAPTLWYPTVQSTRLEIRGTTTEAGSWQIITNDVAPVAVAPAERYSEGSRTGFHPEVGAGQVGGKA